MKKSEATTDAKKMYEEALKELYALIDDLKAQIKIMEKLLEDSRKPHVPEYTKPTVWELDKPWAKPTTEV